MSAWEGAEPVATYRLQVSTVGGLDGVAALADHLRDLGVSHLYLSPIMRARSGSAHGYDVVDPGQVDPDIGGEAALERLGAACRAHGLGLVLDIVPNHMAATHENPWWWDLLARGAASPFASFFDVDLDEPLPPARGRVILPILGRRYVRTLESGELQVLADREGGVVLRFWEHLLPLDVSRHPVLGGPDGGATGEGDAASGTGVSGRATGARPSGAPGSGGPETWEAALARLDATRRDAGARAELDALLARQPYWLVHWRTAPEELNYRRFFDISHLVALRMERPEVFDAWHRGLADLLRRHPVDGLRVDHVDGLADPARYLERLRELVASTGRDPSTLLVLVEKILGPDEPLPSDWAVDGTTGYDFLAIAEGALLDAEGLEALARGWHTFSGRNRSYAEEVRRNKRRALQSHFRRDLDRLVRRALPLVRSDPRGRDAARSEIEAALAEMTVQLDVYRTYRARGSGPRPIDAARLGEAAARTRRSARALPAPLVAVLHDLLLGPVGDPERGLELAEAWQQLTGAVMAKGVEDTTFYVYGPLLSTNEVGGEPPSAPRSVADLHEALAARGRAWPRSLNATSTHDTKRSEDVRARLHVLTEVAEEWTERVVRWHAWNRSLRETVRGRPVPTPNEEWMLYQTLVGVWPLEERPDEEALLERLGTYLRKAAREAKEHTSWYRPRPEHEEALARFARRILEPDRDAPFREDLLAFQRRIAFHGAVDALALLALKLAGPGIPDFYQGTELWALHLVDPDNRAPADWARSRRLLADLKRDACRNGSGGALSEEVLGELLGSWRDGRVKLLLTWRGLACRRAHASLLREGDHLPLDAEGPRSRHVIAFARRHDGDWLIALAPRLPAGFTEPERFPLGFEVWADTAVTLPEGAPRTWTDAVTGYSLRTEDDGRLRLGSALARFPVALLQGRAARPPATSDASPSRKRGTSSGPPSA